LAIAIVFGVYYLWQGVRAFFETGGLGVVEATQRAVIIRTATAIQQPSAVVGAGNNGMDRPTLTPIPPCREFEIRAEPSAILRSDPTTRGEPLDTLTTGAVICVISEVPESDWYLVDRNPRTTRVDEAYIRRDLVRALNPTLTPSRTFTPAPSVTPAPTLTPSITPIPSDTLTPEPSAPSLTPTATPGLYSA
jgi:hypothetical protein